MIYLYTTLRKFRTITCFCSANWIFPHQQEMCLLNMQVWFIFGAHIISNDVQYRWNGGLYKKQWHQWCFKYNLLQFLNYLPHIEWIYQFTLKARNGLKLLQCSVRMYNEWIYIYLCPISHSLLEIPQGKIEFVLHFKEPAVELFLLTIYFGNRFFY